MHLVIANKLYSSWSMRPWLVMVAFDISFRETVVPLRQDDTQARIRVHSPTGKVPVLIDDDTTVWESLAIITYLAGKFPDKSIWPDDRPSRGQAMALSAEMHCGYRGLRSACPMNFTKRFAKRDYNDEVLSDVARLQEAWRTARAQSPKPGPFLFGDFCAADAMFAPVVSRLETYQFDVEEDTRAYMHAVTNHHAYRRWRSEALKESWRIAEYEDGHMPEESFVDA